MAKKREFATKREKTEALAAMQEIDRRHLDGIFEAVATGIEHLDTQSEIGDGGRARILFYALAGFLEERGLIDDLKAAANYIGVQQSVVF